jgi:capsular exopolysaccharide synthesis family protein
MSLSGSTRWRAGLRTLSRRWLVLLLIPIMVGGTVYLIEADQPARYEASASVLIQTQDLGAVLAGVPDLSNSDPSRVLATEQVIAAVPKVRANALEALGVPDGSSLARSATVSFGTVSSFTSGDANVLTVTATAEDAGFAERFATAVAEQYIAFRARVENATIAKARDQVDRRMSEIRNDPSSAAEYRALVSRAEKLETLLLLGSDRAHLLSAPTGADKVAPTPLKHGIVGAVIGLLVAAGLAALLDRVDRSVRSDEEIGRILEAPLLARLPDPRRLGRRETAIALSEPDAAETEAFRLLRANLRFSLLGREGHSVGVTSANEAEGKTFVACNLAVVAAAAGARVVIVDLDLRRPTLHRVLRLERAPGLADVLTGSASLEDALVEVPVYGRTSLRNGAAGRLQVLTAGAETPNPGEVCGSMATRALLADLEARCDLMIVDTPPTSVVTDAIPIASGLSGMLGVVRRPGLRKPAIDALRESLAGIGGPMGVVLIGGWQPPAAYYAYRTPQPAAPASPVTDPTRVP